MTSPFQLWSSFIQCRAECHEPNPPLQVHQPTLEIYNTPPPADAPTISSMRPQQGPGSDLMDWIRLQNQGLELTQTVESPLRNLRPPFAYPTAGHYRSSYYRALLDAERSEPPISPVYPMAEPPGFPVATAGPQGPIPDCMDPDRFRIHGFEDPSGFHSGPSMPMMHELPSIQRREFPSDLLENKPFNGEDLVSGELLRRDRDWMEMGINDSDFSGRNKGKGKAVSGGTSRYSGGNGEWHGSSSGLSVVEKMEDVVPKRKRSSSAHKRRRPKEYKFFPMKKSCSRGRNGGGRSTPAAPVADQAETAASDEVAAAASAPTSVDLMLKLSV